MFEKFKKISKIILIAFLAVTAIFRCWWMQGFYYLGVVFTWVPLYLLAVIAFLPKLEEKYGKKEEVKPEAAKNVETKVEPVKKEEKPAVPQKAAELEEKEKELEDLNKQIDKALDEGNVEKANNLIGKYAKLQAEIENEQKAASEAAKKAEEAAKAIADARARFEALKKKK